MKKELLRLIEKRYSEYDFKYHIKSVVKNALLLANKLKADKEVVEMAAYLHDISRSRFLERDDVEKFVRKNEHHILGAEESKKILKEHGYGDEFAEKVAHCVLAHRGRQGPEPETLEAEIIACADAMAHFDMFLGLVPVFIKTNKGSFEKAIDELEGKMQRNWNKKLTLPEAKKISKEKYEAIMLLIKSAKEFTKGNGKTNIS